MNKKFKIVTETSQGAAAAAAGEELTQLLKSHAENPALLLLSGGSALQILDYVGTMGLNENLTVGMVDERFSLNNKINNFAQLQKTEFYQQALSQDVNFFGSLPRPNEKAQELSSRMEKNLLNWKNENPNGKILATFGMGTDGHTAGIFPMPEHPELFKKLFQNENWVAFYEASGKTEFPSRITATLTFFEKIDEALVFATGQEKQEPLNKVLENKNKIFELPALGWSKIKNVKIFTDIKTS